MKKFIVGILSIFAFIHGLFGDVPSSLPIGSRQLLQAQALQNAAVANAGGWSSSTLGGNGNITYSTRKVANGIQGLEALKLKVHAATAALPYVHQKQPMAVEAVGKTAGLLVLPGEGGTAEEQAEDLGFDLVLMPDGKAMAYQQLSDDDFGQSDEPQSEGEGK